MSMLLPILQDQEDYSNWVISFGAFLATEKLSRVIQPNFAPPNLPAAAAGNTPQALAARTKYETDLVKYSDDDERTYGFALLALEKVTVLRDAVLAHPSVLAAPTSGSTLLRAIRAEVLDNPNNSVYDAIITRIDQFRQRNLKLPQALQELDRLYSLLKDDLQPSNNKKVTDLRKHLSSNYLKTIQTLELAKENVSYPVVCKSLLAEYRREETILAEGGPVESDEVHLVTTGRVRDIVSNRNYKRRRAVFRRSHGPW